MLLTRIAIISNHPRPHLKKKLCYYTLEQIDSSNIHNLLNNQNLQNQTNMKKY